MINGMEKTNSDIFLAISGIAGPGGTINKTEICVDILALKNKF